MNEEIVLVLYTVAPNDATPGKVFSNQRGARSVCDSIRALGLPAEVFPIPVYKIRKTT